MNFQSITTAIQQFFDSIDTRITAFEDAPTLYKNVETLKNQRDQLSVKLTASQAEAKSWKAKFDGMWSAYRKLAVETKGKEAAEKIMQELHNG